MDAVMMRTSPDVLDRILFRQCLDDACIPHNSWGHSGRTRTLDSLADDIDNGLVVWDAQKPNMITVNLLAINVSRLSGSFIYELRSREFPQGNPLARKFNHHKARNGALVIAAQKLLESRMGRVASEFADTNAYTLSSPEAIKSELVRSIQHPGMMAVYHKQVLRCSMRLDKTTNPFFMSSETDRAQLPLFWHQV